MYVCVREGVVGSEGSHVAIVGEVLPVCVHCDVSFFFKKGLPGETAYAHLFANMYVRSGDPASSHSRLFDSPWGDGSCFPGAFAR